MVAAWPVDHNRVATAIINTTGSGYHVLPLPDARLNLGPGAWAPNGSRIALSGWDNSSKDRAGIYGANASDGKGLLRLTTSPDGRNDDPLAYSPDGSRLLFFHEGPQFSQQPEFGDLFTTTATGTGRVKLNPPGTQVPYAFGPASWSPDGRQVAFTAYSNPPSSGQSAVFVTDANGSNRHRITAWGTWMTGAHWSPVGNWIEFDKLTTGGHNLFLLRPNGTGVKQITFSSFDGMCCAAWSPDGKKLLTVQQHDGYLVTMNWNGSGMRRLTHADVSTSDAEYAWGR